MQDTQSELLRLLDRVLSLKGRGLSFDAQTPLLGSVPELDSMAVATVVTSLEETFGIAIEDEEINGETFASVGDLLRFVEAKMG